MSRLFFVAAMILFFCGAVGVHPIPHEEMWGFFCLALGLALTGVPMSLPWKKTSQ